MILDCLRHGITTNNLAGQFNADDDVILTEEVARLSMVRLSVDYDLIHVSPLPRAIQTANALGLQGYKLDARLRERSFGRFQGLTPDDCAARFPEAYSAFQTFDPNFAPPGGESRRAHLDRVRHWLTDLPVSTQGRALAITHGGVIDFLYRLGASLDLHGGPIHAGTNLGVSCFEVNGADIRLLSFSQPLGSVVGS